MPRNYGPVRDMRTGTIGIIRVWGMYKSKVDFDGKVEWVEKKYLDYTVDHERKRQ